MIIDVTGIILTPGSNGENCFGNVKHTDEDDSLIECCCDECDYFLECFPEFMRLGKYIIYMNMQIACLFYYQLMETSAKR